MKNSILNLIIKLYHLWFVLLMMTCIITQAYIKTYHNSPLSGVLFAILFAVLYLVSSSAKKRF